jgi:MoxR-like ATPase
MQKLISAVLSSANQIILGKQQEVQMALCCLLAKGHLLIEDIPGVGKTTLAHTLARLLGLQYQRIQFTSDILPADIIGASIFDTETKTFKFHPGPIFNQMILADEINRSTPKAQSALLEAMEERQVTAEGTTHILPRPFFVIATQNPIQSIGTFPLPESQLDRFLMRIQLGYPNRQAERELLQGTSRHTLIEQLETQLPIDTLEQAQASASEIFVSDSLLDYIQSIIQYTRESNDFPYGLSPRAGLALVSAARAWAFIQGREAVIPDDVQQILPAVAGHRLRASVSDSNSIVEKIINSVPVI